MTACEQILNNARQVSSCNPVIKAAMRHQFLNSPESNLHHPKARYHKLKDQQNLVFPSKHILQTSADFATGLPNLLIGKVDYSRVVCSQFFGSLPACITVLHQT